MRFLLRMVFLVVSLLYPCCYMSMSCHKCVLCMCYNYAYFIATSGVCLIRSGTVGFQKRNYNRKKKIRQRARRGAYGNRPCTLSACVSLFRLDPCGWRTRDGGGAFL